VSRRCGFTLLELLLATVLTVMLMVGVLAVVTRLAAPAIATPADSTAGAHAADELNSHALLRLLREDLNHARKVNVSFASTLSFVSFSALDGANRQRVHRPVRVSYSIETVGGRRWLVRRQAALDAKTNQNVQRDLVCSGVTEFELLPYYGPSEGDADVVTAAVPEAPVRPSVADAVGGGGEVRRRRDPPDPRESFVLPHVGLSYYYEHLPAWAQQDILRFGEVRRVPPTRLPPGADEDALFWNVVAGTGWRLRVWGGGERPVLDTIVTVRLEPTF